MTKVADANITAPALRPFTFATYRHPQLKTPIVMVAYNPRSPRDDSRSLSSDAAAQLRSALGAHWAESEGCDEELAAALKVVAQDARTRGLRPEELLLAMKAVEEEVAVALRVDNTQDRDRLRMWLVGACMRAFFAPDGEDV